MSNLVKRMDLRGAKATLAALPWMPRAILPHPERRALSSARPTPLLRASRFALLALALCGALLLMATPASAQETVVTLVKNTGQGVNAGASINTDYPSEAQGFVTGSATTGYTLDSIGINFTAIAFASQSTVGSQLTVTLNANNSGDPGDALCTLTDPATFTASGVNAFGAPSSGTTCPTLAASATYFVVATWAGTGSVTIGATDSDSEDSGAATGWSVEDDALYLDSGSWLSSASAAMIEVKGFVAPVATPGVTVSESTVSVTEGGATDTYTVVLDTAPTGDVVIAVTETSADISVNPTTLTFGTGNWSTAQTVTVTAVDDSTAEEEETATITHSVSTSADTTNYPTTLTVDSVSVTVSDNDASAPGAPVLTAAAKNESIELTWTIADHGTSNITRFEYRIKETTGGTYPATWTDTGAAASNTGGSATIGSLTNATQYTVQVRGVSSDGEGAGSNEPTATPQAPPAITSVAITSDPGTDKTYIIGEDIVVTFTFDKNIMISGTGLDPYMYLYVGTLDSEPTCTVGTAPTKELVCSYTVVENDEDTGGVEVGQNLATLGKKILGPLEQRANTTHSGLAADSDHKVDGVKPTLVTTGSNAPKTTTDGSIIVLTFSEDIGTADRTKITVKSGTATKAITSTSWTLSSVSLLLTTALLSTDTNVTVEFAADAVKDVPGNGIDAVSPMAVSLVDNTAPTFVSAGTNDTDEVVLTYSEALNTTQPATSAFTVKVGGNNRGVDTVAISGSAVTLTLASAFRPGDALTVSYAQPGSNRIKDAANNEAVSLAETTVTNNLAATAPEAPDGLASSEIPVPAKRMCTWTNWSCSGSRRGTTAATSRSFSTATLRAPRFPERPAGRTSPIAPRPSRTRTDTWWRASIPAPSTPSRCAR